MPTSTVLQLVSRGRQDAYLTTNPQFTFFRQVFRRHTPFAIESIPIEFDGTPDFGRRVSTLIPRKAELLSALFLEVDLPPLPQPDPNNPTYFWANDIGHALIRDVSIEIGDQEIDKHTGEWLQIWGELTTPAEKQSGYYDMIGHWEVYPPPAIDATQPLRLTIPLRFWFCTTIGAALPLIALQAHPVRLIMHLRPFQELWWSADLSCTTCPTIEPVSISRLQLFGDYIFLDKPERQQFAASQHEYLIDQLQIAPVQSVAAGATKANISLAFNHCCKEFLWTIHQTRMDCVREWFNYSNAIHSNGGEAGVVETDLLESALIRLDGYDRFYRRGARYFRITQAYQRHTTIPHSPMYVYLYSFSLRPEDDQPSGTINCSKIDDIVLNLEFNTGVIGYERNITVYATNYNVFRIVGGLGGLAFIA
jgi:hypothetical protein